MRTAAKVWIGLSAGILLVLLGSASKGADIRHTPGGRGLTEAQREEDVMFIINIPFALTKLEGDTVLIGCELKTAQGDLIGRRGREVPVDRFTGAASGTVTLRLNYMDPTGKELPKGPINVRCWLDSIGKLPIQIVQQPPTGIKPRIGQVRPGAVLEVNGVLP